MPIRLMENFRAIFYSPYYATHALGFYEREGVAVELLTSNAPSSASRKRLGRVVGSVAGSVAGESGVSSVAGCVVSASATT